MIWSATELQGSSYRNAGDHIAKFSDGTFVTITSTGNVVTLTRFTDKGVQISSVSHTSTIPGISFDMCSISITSGTEKDIILAVAISQTTKKILLLWSHDLGLTIDNTFLFTGAATWIMGQCTFLSSDPDYSVSKFFVPWVSSFDGSKRIAVFNILSTGGTYQITPSQLIGIEPTLLASAVISSFPPTARSLLFAQYTNGMGRPDLLVLSFLDSTYMETLTTFPNYNHYHVIPVHAWFSGTRIYFVWSERADALSPFKTYLGYTDDEGATWTRTEIPITTISAY
jgi:hypothetical protein